NHIRLTAEDRFVSNPPFEAPTTHVPPRYLAYALGLGICVPRDHLAKEFSKISAYPILSLLSCKTSSNSHPLGPSKYRSQRILVGNRNAANPPSLLAIVIGPPYFGGLS
ncbi:hypothetical protein MMC24_002200, partial [Lignoscripta atroalba]|nr:hypothetical protein [Lignoscripta atroalba]